MIWLRYDSNQFGALNKDQTKKFINDILIYLGFNNDLFDMTFDSVFQSYYTDDSRTIGKEDMTQFIKKLLGRSNWI